MQLMKLLFLIALGWTISASASVHDQGSRKIVVPDGNGISICDANRFGKSECKLTPLPRSVGHIEKLIVVDSLVDSQLSVIVVAKKKTSLCAVNSSGKSLCTQILAPSMEKIELSSAEGPEARAYVMFSPDVSMSRAEARERTVRFMYAFSQAQSRLNRVLSAKAEPKAASSSGELRPTLVDVGGGETCHASIDGDDGCASDGGDGSDSGGGGDGGGGASDGGSAGDSGGAPDCVYGPVIVCTAPPPTIPPDTAPETPSNPPLINTCQLFGLNCPTIPPPVTPIGETVEERKQQCLTDYDRDMDECSAYFGAYGTKTWMDCKDRAGRRLALCLRAAEGK